MTWDHQTSAVTEIAEVRSQLEQILASEGFQNADGLSRFLRFVVDETLEGRSDTIKESTIGIEVFSRGVGYDPKIDSIVRVEARKLRSRLEAYYLANPSAPVRIEIPKGSYVARFHFDADTGEGGTVPSATIVEEPALPAPQVNRRRWVFGLAATGAGAALAGVAYWSGYHYIGPPTSSRPLAMAVLPIQNLTGDPETERFSNGLTGELTTAIGKVPYLGMVSRESALKYRGKPVDVRQAGLELNVRKVLVGSVQRQQDRYRVVVELSDTETGFTRWSIPFDRETKDPLTLQIEIARQVAARIEEQIVGRKPNTK